MNRLIIFLLALALPSCSPSGGGMSPVTALPPVSPGQSRLVAVNAPDSVGGVVTVDGDLQRALPQGGMTTFDLEPGFHRVEFHLPGTDHSRWFRTPSFPPGETLYFAALPSASFRANRAEALRLGMPIDDDPFLNKFGANSVNFRSVTAEQAAKIPRPW